MIHARHVIGLAVAVLVIACFHAEAEAARRKAGICKPAAAAALDGKSWVTDRQARRLTGATIVRQIRPGQGVTMDYRRERVTIETDARTGRIVRAFCG